MTIKKVLQETPESLVIDVVRERGLEPPHLAAPDPKSGASAITHMEPVAKLPKSLSSIQFIILAKGKNKTSGLFSARFGP